MELVTDVDTSYASKQQYVSTLSALPAVGVNTSNTNNSKCQHFQSQ